MKRITLVGNWAKRKPGAVILTSERCAFQMMLKGIAVEDKKFMKEYMKLTGVDLPKPKKKGDKL